MTTVQVLVRRWGQHNLHVADVAGSAVIAARFADTNVTAVKGPVIARCGTTLTGRLVVVAGGISVSRCLKCRELAAGVDR